MEAALILTGAMTLLKPLLQKAGEKAAETIGEKIAQKTVEKSFWGKIKSLFINDNEIEIIEKIEKKEIASNEDLILIENKLKEEIRSNPTCLNDLKASLNITSANEFIAMQAIDSIGKAQIELDTLRLKYDLLDEIDRGKYKIRIMERENDLFNYQNRLINILTNK